MNSNECSTRHPLEPPVLLRAEGTDDLCVLCVLATVVHGGIVCAVRQAALSSLQRIIEDSAQLLSLGPATISRIHSRLLSSLLCVSPPPPAPFASQLTMFICTLSFVADATLHPHSPATATSLVSAIINASVSAIHNRSCSVALPLLANITSFTASSSESPSFPTPCSVIIANVSDALVSKYLCAVLGRNALAFVRALLKRPPDVTTWPSTATVLNATVRAAPLTLPADKIIPLIPVPPTLRAHTASTTAYLSVISTIIEVHSNNASEVLINSLEDFLAVVRHALLSTDSGLSMLAANTVTTLTRLSSVAANTLVQNGIFEYLVETLRTTDHPSASVSDCSPPSLSALAAISSQCPDALISKWPYALSVITACSETVALDTVSSLLITLRAAFNTAAVSVFSHTVVQQMVTLILRIFNRDCLASSSDLCPDDYSLINDAIECLLILLSRYQINIDTIHTVLSVSEICSTDNASITYGLRVFQACATRFCDLAEKQNDDFIFNDEEGRQLRRQQKSALTSLGKRLIFILLDTFGPILYSKIDTFETATSFLGSVDGVIIVMRAFACLMHPAFTYTGCISAAEHLDVRQAFWNMLPLRVAYTSVRGSGADKERDLNRYISGLLADMSHEGSSLATSKPCKTKAADLFPVSVADFAKKLAEDVCPMDSAVSFQIVQKGIVFKNVQAVCETGVIVDALSKRLENIIQFGDDIAVNMSRQWQHHLVNTLLSISSLCRVSNMVFPVGCLNEDTVRVFVSRCEDLSREEAFNIVCEILCLKRLEDHHLIIWEKLSDLLPYSYTVHANELKSSLYVMCETTEVVLQGIVNAILRSTVPKGIANLVCCIYLHGKNHAPRLKVVSKRDVIQIAVQQLAYTRSALKRDSDKSQSDNWSYKNDFDMDCLRASALLEIIVSTDAISDTAASWSLLTMMTEVFALVGTVLTLNHAPATLHASMLRCMVQMVNKTQDSKRLMYMIETGGVLKHCIRILKAVPDANIGVWELQRNESIISNVGCFILVMIQNGNGSIREVCENVVLSELTSNSEVWECALADHLERHEVKAALRISYLTALLQKICVLARGSSKPICSTSFVSSYVLTLACVSCMSPRFFVSDVNHLLLSTVLESGEKMTDLIPQDVLYVLSEITISRLCSLNGQLVATNELNCSMQLVILGKADRHLTKLHDSLYDTWKEWNNLFAKWNSTTVNLKKKSVPSSSLARLLLATRDRISSVSSKTNPSIMVKPISQEDLKRMESESKESDGDVPSILQSLHLFHVHNP